LSDEAFGATYFPARWTEAASKVRRIVGEELDIDISRALPSDRFVDDLRMDDLDSLASITIIMRIEEEFGITITDDEAKKIITIEQLVNCVGCKLDSKRCLLDQELGT
jgi:acyl carrier protein